MKDWDPEPMVREWSAEAGQGKEMAYAEGFRVITLVSDEDFSKLQEDADRSAPAIASKAQA
jgi:hypothetical protein